jgi:predicted  nucleic acid-binding Zn-ribbon protein
MYAYEKLMKEENLKLEELPNDAKIGIKTLQNIEKIINMRTKKGKKPTQSILDKVKANDKWVVREILDYLEDKDTNTEPLPNTEKEIVQEIKEADTKAETTEQKLGAENKPADAIPDLVGFAIEDELKKLFEAGKTEIQLEELKAKAPKSYSVIFDGYDDSGDNGIETTNYTIIETSEKVFTINKN